MLAADAAGAGHLQREELLPPATAPIGAVNTNMSIRTASIRRSGVDGAAYLYAPHFAHTVTTPGEDGTVGSPTGVSIRTARQLYALSLYYDEYRERLR